MNRGTKAVRSRAHAAAAIASCAMIALACAPAPPVHPLGAACTWPESVVPERDDLAVLQMNDIDAEAVALLHVPSGTLRAFCTGLRSGSALGLFTTPGLHDHSAVQFPALSPDLRYGITPTGVIDMHTGVIRHHPDHAVATALPGNGTALYRSPSFDGEPGPDPATGADRDQQFDYPDLYCLAQTVDAPTSACEPLDGAGPGVPAPHSDGTVGWAAAVAVPITFTGPQDGQTVQGLIQTDGRSAIQVRLRPGEQFAGYDGYFPLARPTGLLSSLTTVNALGLDYSQRTVWYRVDPATGSGSLHATPYGPDELAGRLGEDVVGPRGAIVVDDGAAVVVSYLLGTLDIAIVRLDESGGLTEITRIRMSGDDDDAADSTSPVLPSYPDILAWPDGVDSPNPA